MSSKLDYKTIAAALVKGELLDFKSYPDGSLAVITPTGQKFKFTAEQVQAASHSIASEPEPKPSPQQKPEPKPDPKPDPKPATKTTSKRGRPSKAKPASK